MFGIVLFIILTAEISSFFYTYLLPARFAAISVLWTSFSVVLMLIGFRQNNVALRKVSFGLFLVVVLKVFLFDMSNFSTPYRIISFIILGLVLVGTSYLYYRHKDRIITALGDTEKTNEKGTGQEQALVHGKASHEKDIHALRADPVLPPPVILCWPAHSGGLLLLRCSPGNGLCGETVPGASFG